MKFSTNTLNEIKDRIPVSQVVGKKVQLKKKGREYVGLSPFNKEKTPSFTVNDEKQFYHCFSTNKHGDIFTFLVEVGGLSFPEAVEKLAEEAGKYANTVFHPVSTCRMGNDIEAVVNDKLITHGLEGLRIVDASVMPSITSGNTNAPTIMIAEKAADIILADQ